MEKGSEERVINLWDMFWSICLKWRSILVCATVFMFFAGVFSYFYSHISVGDNVVQQETTSEDIYNELTEAEKMFVDVYFDYMSKYEEIYLYNQNSPLMKMDANNFYKGEVNFYVDNAYKVQYPIIDQSNNVSAIVKAYKNTIKTEDFAKHVSEIVEDCVPIYSTELIDDIGEYGEEIQEMEEGDFFSVWVYAASEETCKELLLLVRKTIESNSNYIAEEFGKHDLICVTDSTNNISDVKLWQKQKDVLDEYQNCATHMKNISSAFEEKQQEYVEKRLQEMAEEGTGNQNLSTISNKVVVGVSKKYVAIGFVVGAIIAFGFWMLEYLTSSKIRLEDEFEKYYNSKLLGYVKLFDGRKKWCWFVDNFLIRCRHRNRRYLENEAALEIVLANIRIAVRKSGNKRIIITSAVSGSKEKKLISILVSAMKKDGIDLIESESVLYNSESLEKLVEVGQAVLIEQVEVSLRDEIMKEIELCHQHGVNLIGTVIIY